MSPSLLGTPSSGMKGNPIVTHGALALTSEFLEEQV